MRAGPIYRMVVLQPTLTVSILLKMILIVHEVLEAGMFDKFMEPREIDQTLLSYCEVGTPGMHLNRSPDSAGHLTNKSTTAPHASRGAVCSTVRCPVGRKAISARRSLKRSDIRETRAKADGSPARLVVPIRPRPAGPPRRLCLCRAYTASRSRSRAEQCNIRTATRQMHTCLR